MSQGRILGSKNIEWAVVHVRVPRCPRCRRTRKENVISTERRQEEGENSDGRYNLVIVQKTKCGHCGHPRKEVRYELF